MPWMTVPIALGITSAVTAAAGTAFSVQSQVSSANANAAKMRRDADQAKLEADFQEQQVRRQHSFELSEAEAQSAGMGFDVTKGTSLFLELDRAKQAELDSLYARHEGAVRSADLRYGAGLEKRRGTNAMIGGAIKGGSILTDFMGGSAGQSMFSSRSSFGKNAGPSL